MKKLDETVFDINIDSTDELVLTHFKDDKGNEFSFCIRIKDAEDFARVYQEIIAEAKEKAKKVAAEKEQK